MLQERLKNKKLILASKSPRRQKFLSDLDLDFKIEIKEVEEIYPDDLKGTEITDYLAKLKSEPFLILKDEDILITSDTIVWMDNKAIGKPKNEQEAIEILQKLSGNKHQVITSVCIRSNHKTKVFNDCTNVYFNDLKLEEIKYYVNNFKPFDKAGAYGIQDWIGFIAVKKIEGNFYNVMGFPIHKFYEELMLF